jgi:ferredoxin/protein involved in ribonucleotide reduction
MKTTLYYFSGTGNSLKSAKNLSNKLKNCNIVPIAKMWEQNRIVPQSENIGLIFPLYFMGCPSIVLNFVKKLVLEEINYIFAVITSHHGSFGACFYQLNNLLKKNSKSVNAQFSIKMPGNYIPMYDIAPDDQLIEDFENAKENLDQITDVISNNNEKTQKSFFAPIKNIFSRFFLKRVNRSDKKFYADEKCNSCEICEKICPVYNIKIVNGKPEWQHKCQRCLACIHFCPQKAIQYGKKTIYRKRYHHPEITIEDIINQK